MTKPDIVDIVEAQLPFLRRYARAVTGHAEQGDVHVEAVLLSLVNNGPEHATRHSLFTKLDQHLVSADTLIIAEGPDKDALLAMRANTRRALLLTSMEEFSIGETALIMSRSETEIARLLQEAEDELKKILECRLIIIEDEALIAAGLSQIALSLGHEVVGTANTKASAVELALREKPEFMLVDVKLADKTLGTDAVEEIHKSHDALVIYITAYPETLLTGSGVEPTYLITKPFKATMVKAVISQALMLARQA